MVDALVTFSIDSALSDPERGWLREIFGLGFEGFGEKTFAQLVQEMQFRGLLGADEVVAGAEHDDGNDDDAYDDHEDATESEDAERLVMWSGMIFVDCSEPVTE